MRLEAEMGLLATETEAGWLGVNWHYIQGFGIDTLA